MDQLQSEEEMNSMPFEKCPVCGGDLIEKQVEKVLRGASIPLFLRFALRSACAVERGCTLRRM